MKKTTRQSLSVELLKYSPVLTDLRKCRRVGFTKERVARVAGTAGVEIEEDDTVGVVLRSSTLSAD
jgi:hypothetical protein